MARSSHERLRAGVLLALLLAGPGPLAAEGGSIGGSIEPIEEPRRPVRPEALSPLNGPPRFSFPVNTSPDGWAALKAAPDLRAPRLARIYEGTLFTVIGHSGQWVHVRLVSGETGWIIERLVGCCR